MSSPPLNASTRDGLNWVIGEAHLIRGRDTTAVAYFEADIEADGADTAWIGELVAAARESGQALDERVAEVLAATPTADLARRRFRLICLYLVTGYLDRYFEIILDGESGPPPELEEYVLWGTAFRHWGFTAHPGVP